MVIVDCHAHLSDQGFDEDLSDLMLDFQKENIFVITVGMDYTDFQKVIDISNANDICVGFGLGLHPIQTGTPDVGIPFSQIYCTIPFPSLLVLCIFSLNFLFARTLTYNILKHS